MIRNRLKELRTGRKLKQTDVASILNVTGQAYSYYENGKREMDSETLDKLADYFNTSTDYILCRTSEQNSGKNPKNPSIADKLNSLSPEGRKKAEEYIDMLKTLDEVKGQSLSDIRKKG